MVAAAPVAPNAVAPSPAAPVSEATVPVSADTTAAAGTERLPISSPEALAAARLDHRVQSLEKELSEMQAALNSEREQLFAMQRQAALGVQPAAALPPCAATQARRSAGISAQTIVPHPERSAGCRVFHSPALARWQPLASRVFRGGAAVRRRPLEATAVADAAVSSMALDSAPSLSAAQEPAPGPMDSETDGGAATDRGRHRPACSGADDVEPAGRSEISTNQPPSSTNDDTTIAHA